MKKAFTLVELMVAVGLLALILSFAGIVFNASIDTYRTAAANAEIMRKYRAITDRLDADFQGLCTDAPLMIFFRQDPNDPNQRYDQIMSFAYGDFQSFQPYDGTPLAPSQTGMPIRGNVARVYYGLGYSRDPVDGQLKVPFNLREKDRLLARRGHILSADPNLYLWPDPADVNGTFPDATVPGGYINNEIFEHDSLSLAQWKIQQPDVYGVLGGTVLDTCFGGGANACVDMADPSTFHKLMCEGVGSFAVQWSYRDTFDGATRWYPSADPDGTGTNSHFDLALGAGFPSRPRPVPAYQNFDVFGVVFNIPNAGQMNYWGTAPMMIYRPGIRGGYYRFRNGFFPDALKFTFTLFDSKGIIEKGRRFTHIVYLNSELPGPYQVPIISR
ncbi:MAG: type II secretion system protein [Planctomycetota bacterium]|jgi:prepilin-type N-terminal cleavage/methylation domain-containing protein